MRNLLVDQRSLICHFVAAAALAAFVRVPFLAAQSGKPKASNSKSVSLAKSATKKTSSNTNALKTAGAKASTKKAAASSANHTSKSNAKRAKNAAPPVKRWVQTQPSPDRYKEIQEALAAKGYFGGVPDGNWGEDSIEALKRFQKDQNLETDGKINSLSLIALGLGPKHGPAQSAVSSTPVSTAIEGTSDSPNAPIDSNPFPEPKEPLQRGP
jgi:peptidoglycan hydrolase-like protein with peptidoglycan-binding domain